MTFHSIFLDASRLQHLPSAHLAVSIAITMAMDNTTSRPTTPSSASSHRALSEDGSCRNDQQEILPDQLGSQSGQICSERPSPLKPFLRGISSSMYRLVKGSEVRGLSAQGSHLSQLAASCPDLNSPPGSLAIRLGRDLINLQVQDTCGEYPDTNCDRRSSQSRPLTPPKYRIRHGIRFSRTRPWLSPGSSVSPNSTTDEHHSSTHRKGRERRRRARDTSNQSWSTNSSMVPSPRGQEGTAPLVMAGVALATVQLDHLSSLARRSEEQSRVRDVPDRAG
ncbi:hypothetical protein HJFPF1_12704 [Paramyrothecium foliicola]|nr:hypothetical protein HJFPF1_12704 [Paramyrothecium foliicola]